jgi:hypothetical protein
MRTLIALILFGVIAVRAQEAEPEKEAAPATAAESTPADASATEAKAPEPSTTETKATAPADSKAAATTERGARNVPEGTGFDAFKVIAQRNIFDPNRTRAGTVRPPTERPRRTEAFALKGIIAYEKGDFAFFDGTSSDYRKSVKTGDNFAGYKVVGVAPGQVTLEADGKKVEMPVGSQMKRAEGDEWKMSAHADSFETSGSPRESSGSRESRSDVRTDSRDRENFRRGDRGTRDFNSSGRTGFDSGRNGFDRTSRSSEGTTTSRYGSSSATTSSAPASSSGGGDPAEALRRLLERRSRGE